MPQKDPQAIWEDYYRRIRNRRICEAEQLVAATRNDGINDQSEMFLDFRLFSSVEADLVQLKEQLAENYEVSLTKDKSSDYWNLDGTTRPIEMSLERDQLLEWVRFMADVAQSYACVFSKWVLTEANSGKQWSNESFEATTE